MSTENYLALNTEIKHYGARLVAVSKTKPVQDILALYNAGQRIFGENKVQELLPKYNALPKDIEWHLIGHLQTNKVKSIAPFVAMIESVDSLKLLEEIDKQAAKNKRTIPCLLQVFIATEETKFGLDESELFALLGSDEYKAMQNISICGLMGMATNTRNETQVAAEFNQLFHLFQKIKKQFFADKPGFKEISMGMSADYKIALKCGSTLVRLGSILFGERDYGLPKA
jgi:PLP dependent protein